MPDLVGIKSWKEILRLPSFAQVDTKERFAKTYWLLLCLILLPACSSTPPAEAPPDDNTEPPSSEETYQNPVLNRDFPDPTVIAAPDGWYYAYATETMINAQPYNIQVARSEDLVHWMWESDALPAEPSHSKDCIPAVKSYLSRK